MAKVYTGEYGSGTTAENALNTALMQYPEIARTLITQYPRYSATYLLERTGRFASEKVLGGTAATAGVLTAIDADGNQFYLSFDGEGVHTTEGFTNASFLNKFDMVRFQSGATAVVLQDPITEVVRAAANGGLETTAASVLTELM